MSLPIPSPQNLTPLQESTAGDTARLRAVAIPGPVGQLEALLSAPEEAMAESLYCALICHPHPSIGGTMHFKQVYQMMKAFTALGLPVLRFNFRGTGQSEGKYDFGRGEVHDVHAALDWLAIEFPARPVIVAGYSFGSNIVLRACCGDPRVHGTVLLGLPTFWSGRVYKFSFLPRCQQPKLFITGTKDEYAPRESILNLATTSPHSTTVWVDDADHFLVGRLDEVKVAIRIWMNTTFLQPSLDTQLLSSRALRAG